MLANVVICHHCTLAVSYFMLYKCKQNPTIGQACPPHPPHPSPDSDSLRCCHWEIQDDTLHWLRQKLQENVRILADKVSQGRRKFLLCLDWWFAPVLIIAIKQFQLPSSISWNGICLALNSNNLLWENNTTSHFGAVAGYKVVFVFLAMWITCFLLSSLVNYLQQQQACTLSEA